MTGSFARLVRLLIGVPILLLSILLSTLGFCYSGITNVGSVFILPDITSSIAAIHSCIIFVVANVITHSYFFLFYYHYIFIVLDLPLQASYLKFCALSIIIFDFPSGISLKFENGRVSGGLL